MASVTDIGIDACQARASFLITWFVTKCAFWLVEHVYDY
jgi:hypothetical protein